MTPDPSGMRLTIYHALPTTTTLCAPFDGKVVGTIALIRDSALGLPLQRIFDLTGVRAKRGNIAEVSSLAVHPDFAGIDGPVLLPLLKFMHEYCTTLFDTRHLVIAVHPHHIETYEALLFFRRLAGGTVPAYDFVNGAPAVGARLDLRHAPEIMRKYYGDRTLRRNLHNYFVALRLPNIELPHRRFSSHSEPVITPALIDYFFNRKTTVFARLDERTKQLLHMIYDLPEYRRVLPPVIPVDATHQVRQHRRFPFRCPGRIATGNDGALEISEVSRYCFRASSAQPIPQDGWLSATIQLGHRETALLQVRCVQETEISGKHRYGFQLGEPDLAWRKFINALYDGSAYGDREPASRFLPEA